MRQLILCIIVAGLAGSEPVWIFAGQSNMEGSTPYETMRQSDPGFGTRPEVRIYVPKLGRWGTFGEPAHTLKRTGGVDQCGPEGGFAEAMLATRRFPRIHLIKHAVGNTSLQNHWTAGSGREYITLLDVVKAALAAEPELRIEGFCWLQGENDAPWSAADKYQRNFSALITRLREDLKRPDLPILVARIGSPAAPDKLAGTRTVQAAQRAAVEAAPPGVWFDIEDLPLREDRLHFQPLAYREIGARFAKSWLQLADAK